VAVVIAVTIIATGGLLAAEAGPPGALRIRGADISFTLQEEAVGRSVRGPTGVAPIEQVLAGYGANTVRLRLWVDPLSGTSDLPTALALARRASAAGLQIVLVLQYSDTWADHWTQPTPAAWVGLDLDSLAGRVQAYTTEVVGAFAGQGTPVAVVQVGNEIDHGLLWPVGALATAGWDAVARLVGAGAAGARAGGGHRPPEIMVHLAESGDPEAVLRSLADLSSRGVHPDLVGLSYYPWWNGSLATLAHTLDTVAERLDIDVLLAETAYPWTLADGDEQPNAVTTDAQLPDGQTYPATPEGQAAWAEALRQILLAVPGGHGAGLLFWEPGWLPGVEAVHGVGSAYDNTTLFTWDGGALPALAALRPQQAARSAGGQGGPGRGDDSRALRWQKRLHALRTAWHDLELRIKQMGVA
jgi:arabinogalactan endo-1,4-beta-galactosidase